MRTNKIIINKSQLHRIIHESVNKMLKESISMVCYHFTHPSCLLSIMEFNRIETSDDGGISVTRGRNGDIGYASAFGYEFYDGAYVRLELDGDKINSTCRGKQVDEFGHKPDAHIDDFAQNFDYGARDSFRMQSEDKFYPRNGQYLENAFNYIKFIDIYLYDDENVGLLCNSLELGQFFEKLSKYANSQWDSKIRIYGFMGSTKKDFNFQTKNYITLKQLQDMLESN